MKFSLIAILAAVSVVSAVALPGSTTEDPCTQEIINRCNTEVSPSQMANKSSEITLTNVDSAVPEIWGRPKREAWVSAREDPEQELNEQVEVIRGPPAGARLNSSGEKVCGLSSRRRYSLSLWAGFQALTGATQRDTSVLPGVDILYDSSHLTWVYTVIATPCPPRTNAIIIQSRQAQYSKYIPDVPSLHLSLFLATSSTIVNIPREKKECKLQDHPLHCPPSLCAASPSHEIPITLELAGSPHATELIVIPTARSAEEMFFAQTLVID
ncbi:hypothetical protein MBM_00146 [Drepanopeziza brunnea f. sp. 'multigermtubi' MB_m1]|uniref:Uncharacterized protein n=1 Tax=Marssonina brunnea f. sp. multigermtubi (strain MB_m1) TaxID=1072389 RepID=K1XK54_MARBU|nr:uncharacterized protein MBM_00146 [Drepanopeziza brunnea f. sp. 'multigermtubi' MB_m1]EKD21033.1 hypothetical protein MBM_00146 [Drepanopeziza brunnea f. sp. 'multigermtubi' MB_m1]